MFTVVLIFAKRVITELIAKIFVLERVAVAERAKSSIAAVFINALFSAAAFIAVVFIAMFTAKVKENVIIKS